LFGLEGAILVVVGRPVDGITGVYIKGIEEQTRFSKFFGTSIFLSANIQ
jgi:hypothetical protein